MGVHQLAVVLISPRADKGAGSVFSQNAQGTTAVGRANLLVAEAQTARRLEQCCSSTTIGSKGQIGF